MAPFRQDQLPPANRIFVDRDAAFAIPPDRSTVLVFYGAGGRGQDCSLQGIVAQEYLKNAMPRASTSKMPLASVSFLLNRIEPSVDG